MELLEGTPRNYDWGSTTAIPDLIGRPRSSEPVAELWFGAHPSGPARLGPDGTSLDAVISADPEATLGPKVADAFGALPFLFKVIAADRPLSLQAHPSSAQAREGFAREEAAGVRIDAPERSFRDQSHKPELVCALTGFVALCGFREPEQTLDLLATIPTAALDPVRELLGVGVRETLSWLLELGPAESRELTAAVVAACETATGDRWHDERALVLDLAGYHPADPGVAASLLLHRVDLAPGEALYLGAGTLHSYVAGVAVELMANSDNVVRGGLTTKPIDRPTLMNIVDTDPAEPVVQKPPVVSGVAEYRADVPEFALSRFEIDEGTPVVTTGPAVLLCVDGTVEAGPRTLDRGEAAWVDASEPPLGLTGRGVVFRAGVGGVPSRMEDAAG